MKNIILGTSDADNTVAEFIRQLDLKPAEVRDSKGSLIAIVHPVLELGDPNSKAGPSPRRGKTTQQLLEMLNTIPLPEEQPKAPYRTKDSS